MSVNNSSEHIVWIMIACLKSLLSDICPQTPIGGQNIPDSGDLSIHGYDVPHLFQVRRTLIKQIFGVTASVVERHHSVYQ